MKKIADRAEGGNKMQDGENKNVKGENKELREKLKGTRAKEETQKLGWKTQGADSSEGGK